MLLNLHPLHGKVEVNIGLLEKTEEKTKWVAIRVKDSGIGIPPEKQEKIFERFFQSDVPPSMVNQGSGIGLSITKEFVKLHGGIITVESEVNVGSCFSVLIPFVDIKVDVPQPQSVDESVVALHKIPRSRLYKMDNRIIKLLLYYW